MSIAAIHYSSLTNASNEAKRVAGKLSAYESSLNSLVYKKLSNYSGSCTSNVSEAKELVDDKMSELTAKAEAFTAYAEDLTGLRDRCKSVDKSVKNRVSGLTADFKNVHGIRNNAAVNAINFLLTSIENCTVAGRALSNLDDQVTTFEEYIEQSFEFWWDYGGGEELVTGWAVGLISICLTGAELFALAPAVTAASGVLATIVAVAAVVGSAIILVNLAVDVVNEARAYTQTNANADPALGVRLSEEDTLQDVLRTETDSSLLHTAALGLDVVSAVCTVISAASSAGKKIEELKDWASGCISGTSGLGWKEILTFDNLKTVVSSAVSPLTDLGESIKVGDYSAVSTYLYDEGTDYLNALEKKFVTGSDADANCMALAKTLISGDFRLYNTLTSDDSDISDVAWALTTDTLLNSLGWSNWEIAGYITVTEDGYRVGTITAGSITGLVKSVSGAASSVSSLYTEIFTDTSLLGKDLIEKLSEISDVEISVPEIYVPSTENDVDLVYVSAAA